MRRSCRWRRRESRQIKHSGAIEADRKGNEIHRRQPNDLRPGGYEPDPAAGPLAENRRALFEIGGPNLDQIAGEENITPSYASRIVRLKFLAPDIVAAILAGKQPPELTANKLMADTRLPLDWRDQRTALGFACAIRHIQRYRRRRAKRRSQQRQLTHGKARASARNGRSKATSPCRAVGDPRTTQSPPAQRHPYH